MTKQGFPLIHEVFKGNTFEDHTMLSVVEVFQKRYQTKKPIIVAEAAMLAELYRRDRRGFIKDRHPKDKLVLTCCFVSIMMVSILKSKGIPTRARAGHAPYFDLGELGDVSTDHWINQYWNSSEKR